MNQTAEHEAVKRVRKKNHLHFLHYFMCLSLVTTVGAVPQTAPQFRARTDLIQLDVSVVDKNHQPVRGLSAEDFTVLENGKKQVVQAFLPIELPEEPPREPSWMRDVAPDVVANTNVDEDRLVVMILDDFSEDMDQDLWGQKKIKEIGKGIIDRLGPRDLAHGPAAWPLSNARWCDERAEKTSGSVYADFDVPDFTRDLVSMSGIALSDMQERSVIAEDALGRVPAVIPMTTRTFAASAKVVGLVEVYQGGEQPVQPVPIWLTIKDDREQVVARQADTIDPPQFVSARRAQFRFDLPLAKLAPGEYLLTLETAGEKAKIRRNVRFRVK